MNKFREDSGDSTSEVVQIAESLQDIKDLAREAAELGERLADEEIQIKSLLREVVHTIDERVGTADFYVGRMFRTFGIDIKPITGPPLSTGYAVKDINNPNGLVESVEPESHVQEEPEIDF